jgi:CRISPR-associated protein Csm3
VYVPGASLKGSLRSSAEARLRSIDPGRTGMPEVCDPLRLACAIRLQRTRLPAPDIHKSHCACCRLFGSAALRGRAQIRDQFPWSASQADVTAGEQDNFARANRLELRHRVSIDRRTGTISGGPFDSEAVPAGVAFHGEIALENYQVWQLGMLVAALDELNDGFAQLGAGRNEGLGQVRVHVDAIAHEQRGAVGDPPRGVAALIPTEEAQSYGLLPEGALPGALGESRGLATRYEIRGEGPIGSWLDAARAVYAAIA